MDNFLYSINATLPIFLLIILGKVLYKIGLIDDKFTKVSVIPSKERKEHKGYFELEQLESGLTTGSTYKVNNLEGFTRNLWICPVTLFVLGQYPKFIYVKKL